MGWKGKWWNLKIFVGKKGPKQPFLGKSSVVSVFLRNFADSLEAHKEGGRANEPPGSYAYAWLNALQIEIASNFFILRVENISTCEKLQVPK